MWKESVWFREIPEGWLDRIYVSEHFMEEESHVKVLQGKNYEVLANHVFESVSDTKTPQGILCLVKMPDYTLEEVIPKENAHLLILESIQDPAFKARGSGPEREQESAELS